MYGVVWFKRDLRIADHAALHHAAMHGPVLCLYVIEPAVWAEPDAANQHYQFILESLRELDHALRRHGGMLHIVVGEMPRVLEDLFMVAPFAALYSHEETGNGVTYARDRAVAAWCALREVDWHEYPQFGVMRGLRNRTGWNALWERFVAAPCASVPQLEFYPLPLAAVEPPAPESLGLLEHDPPQRQRGGRAAGLYTLQTFLRSRSGAYRGGISSPLSAPTACSRISPYLTYGCISLRETVQAMARRMQSLTPEEERIKRGLTAFLSRLHWHCHFMQKLESEPELEFRNLHRGYDGLRESEWDQAHFEALVAGRTGFPLIDACVAMLRETGWINFRMRAMLVSTAAYPLWLHWRTVGLWLAREFLDYEPGIHWSQMQMQSGTTGINTARIYNPVKQAQDHDPRGVFVRRWLPAMRRVPDSWLFEPWRMPVEVQERFHLRVGRELPAPIVDLETATRTSKQRIFALRARPEIQAVLPGIVERHGSRMRRDSLRPTQLAPDLQLRLDI